VNFISVIVNIKSHSYLIVFYKKINNIFVASDDTALSLALKLYGLLYFQDKNSTLC